MSYLYRTADFSSSNDSKCVLSFWVKKTKNDTLQGLFLGFHSSTDYATCYVNTDDTIYYKEKQSNTQYETRITSSARKFRDTNAWYHFVFQWDYAQATASNRIKVWINGELQTWENTGNLPPHNNTLRFKSSDFRIGNYTHEGSNYYTWQGLMSHVHFIDDAPYDTYQASSFGETDSTTGEWKIKADPQIATNNYGSQGFFVLKDGNSGTDQSGKGNNLSTSGTITKTEDCPSNVFATANPLDVMKQSGGIYKPTFSNGNLTLSCNSATNYQTFGTIAVDTGKYYWETKATDCDGHRLGVFFGDNKVHSGSYYYGANAFYIHQNGIIYYNGSITTYMSSLSDGDIVGVALDRTNGHIYLHKNGQYADGNGNNDQTFANAVSISTKLGVTMPSDITYPFFDVYGTAVMDINFGNGFFGTQQVSSAGTNASGNGIFEYDVPTGYTALSTRGLNL